VKIDRRCLVPFAAILLMGCAIQSQSQNISVSPSSIKFPNQGLNTTSAAVPVTLWNNQAGTLTISNIQISAPFAQTNNCPAVLAPGQSCTISFTFTPNGAGARTAQIQIEDDAPDGPHLIRLNGMGLGKGRLQFSNDYWQFNQQPVGQPSGPGVIYIYNPGTDAINFSSIAISGGNSSDFAIGANSCGAAIAPYTTCAIAFQFTPQAAGGRSSTLVFIDDSSTGRQAIPLTGTGY